MSNTGLCDIMMDRPTTLDKWNNLAVPNNVQCNCFIHKSVNFQNNYWGGVAFIFGMVNGSVEFYGLFQDYQGQIALLYVHNFSKVYYKRQFWAFPINLCIWCL